MIYLGAPAADEGDVVQQGRPSDLLQGLHHVVDVHVAQQHPEAEAALKLLDAVVDVLRLQQVVPAHPVTQSGTAFRHWEGSGQRRTGRNPSAFEWFGGKEDRHPGQVPSARDGQF